MVIQSKHIIQERVEELILSGQFPSIKEVLDVIFDEYAYTKEAIVNAIFDIADVWWEDNYKKTHKKPMDFFERYNLICYNEKGTLCSDVTSSDIDYLLKVYCRWKDENPKNMGKIIKINTYRNKVLQIILDDYEEASKEEEVMST